MKRLKFLDTISLDSKPIWYKNCVYEVVRELDGRYDLVSEDLMLRGIDKKCENIHYVVLEDKEEPKKETREESKEEIKEETSKAIKPNQTHTKKSKKNKSKRK